MRLFYISQKVLRLNRADPFIHMHACREFVRNGYEVTIIAPWGYRKDYAKNKKEIWKLYNLNNTFKIVELPMILAESGKFLLYIRRLQKYLLFLIYFFYLISLQKINNDSVIYSFCYASTAPLIFLKKIKLLKCKIIFVKATYSLKKTHSYIIKNVDGFVIYSKYIADKLIHHHDISPKIIFKGHFTTLFGDIGNQAPVDTQAAKLSLGFNPQSKLALYAGKVGPAMKEVEYIIESAKFLPDITFVILGLSKLKNVWDYYNAFISNRGLENVILIAHQPVAEYYKYLMVADLLLSYYSSDDFISETQRKPAKAVVYLCTGKPIIFADMPALREFMDDDMVYFVTSDDPKRLAEKIKFIFNNPDHAKAKVQKCLKFAQEYSFENVFLQLSHFINNICKS